MRKSKTQLIIQAAILGGLLNTAMISSVAIAEETTAAASQSRQYNVSAGSLSSVLSEFAGQAGILLSSDAQLTTGKNSQGLTGQYSVDQALKQLLQDTGIDFNLAGDSVTLIAGNAGDSTDKEDEVDSINKIKVLSPLSVIGTAPARYEATHSSAVMGVDVALIDTPRTIQVIPEQLILDQGAQDLRDVLKNVSGIQAVNTNGGTSDSFILRGFELKHMIQDGLQMSRDSLRIQTENIERVEVVKGPNAILTGQTQPGGTINIVTKKPQEESRHMVSTAFDDFGRKEIMLDTTGKATESNEFLYRLVVAIEDTDTFRRTDEKANISRNLIAPSLTWNINEDSNLTAGVEFISSTLPFDHGTITLADPSGVLHLADIPQSRRLGEHNNIADSKQWTANIGYELNFADDWVLNARINHHDSKGDLFFNGARSVTPAGVLTRSQFHIRPEYESTLMALQLSKTFDFLHTEHKFVTGIDNNQRKTDFEILIDFSNPNTTSQLDIYNPVYGQAPVADVGLFSRSDTTQSLTSFYFQDLITFNDRWKAMIGARVDSFKLEGTSTRLSTGIVSDISQGTQSEISPNFGVIFKATDQLSLYTSYSESFSPNSASTNPISGEVETVEPGEGEQFEVGLKGSYLNDNLIFTLAYFDITRTNIPVGTDPVTGVRLINGEEVSSGLEMDVSLQFFEGFNLTFNHSYMADAKVTEGTRNGNDIRNVPEHTTNLWLSYEFTKGSFRGLGLGGGASYVGRRFVDSNNTFELDSETTVNATAFYYFPLNNGSQLRAQLSVNNLTNERTYIPNSNVLGIGVGEPRTIFLSIGYEY